MLEFLGAHWYTFLGTQVLGFMSIFFLFISVILIWLESNCFNIIELSIGLMVIHSSGTWRVKTMYHLFRFGTGKFLQKKSYEKSVIIQEPYN